MIRSRMCAGFHSTHCGFFKALATGTETDGAVCSSCRLHAFVHSFPCAPCCGALPTAALDCVAAMISAHPARIALASPPPPAAPPRHAAADTAAADTAAADTAAADTAAATHGADLVALGVRACAVQCIVDASEQAERAWWATCFVVAARLHQSGCGLASRAHCDPDTHDAPWPHARAHPLVWHNRRRV